MNQSKLFIEPDLDEIQIKIITKNNNKVVMSFYI